MHSQACTSTRTKIGMLRAGGSSIAWQLAACKSGTCGQPRGRVGSLTAWMSAAILPLRILSFFGLIPPLPPLPPLHAITGLTARCEACAASGLTRSAEAQPARARTRAANFMWAAANQEEHGSADLEAVVLEARSLWRTWRCVVCRHSVLLLFWQHQRRTRCGFAEKTVWPSPIVQHGSRRGAGGWTLVAAPRAPRW